ncbi:MAG: phosphoenolpyruvate carboxykinase (GTP) [Chlamydiae bacterium]|nr:phosphoenolpyruvate carboxykinase (GTP) [Chlamydiota bacterium]MBI3277997.1 phosphoenolpyruvate carboxykinase (GTP) [Chlamydiota bacterium]
MDEKQETNSFLTAWVKEVAQLCKPDQIYWCNGSEKEREELTQRAIEIGDLEELNPSKLPGCYLHRSVLNDVARTEELTFISTSQKEEAGPTNHWMSPQEAYLKLGSIFDGSMKGRTMYVIPFIMGPIHSPFSKVGVQITDSLYVVLNMRIMTRMGRVALNRLGNSKDFTRCLHGKADLDIKRRFICHFPEDNTIWSVGSGYGGNALLGKKCLALRIGSFLGKRENWLAEHMLIMGVENPQGEITYVAAAFPSQCGKTNLAMMVPPFSQKGYKIWTVGDDIAWLNIGPDGRLWAINPEAGFFGVLPGTSSKSNPNALKTIQKNTIFTNVLKKIDGTVWWEGLDGEPPLEGIDWRGQPWTPASGEKGAHPNSRFTAPATQCPSISPEWESPRGVPISAIIFGGRRAKLAPLVFQSLSWQHGVFLGASMASETTAAATGKVGVVRHDPMAMLPFCGYNMGDYFSHWLSMGKKMKNPPKIFHVNWFKTDDHGKFLWPGYGDNLRVVRWIVDRCQGIGKATRTPIGDIPTSDAIDITDLSLSQKTLQTLFEIDPQTWLEEIKELKQFFEKFENHFPEDLMDELKNLEGRLKDSSKFKV